MRTLITTNTPKGNSVYIDYKDCKNGFKPTRTYFKNYTSAFSFMLKTFDHIDKDLIYTI